MFLANKLNVTSLKKLVFFDVADVEFDTDEEESESFVTLPTNREYDEYGFLDDEADDLDHSQTVDFLNSSIKEEKVIEEPKDENELITPALGGTLRALKAAHKSKVKKPLASQPL